ncbi:MAG: hypothetical protein ACTSSJ_00880 [Candidatus Odinarchaeia archaeon]
MSNNSQLIYEDVFTISSWIKFLPLFVGGVFLICLLSFLSPIEIDVQYNALYNYLLSFTTGGALIIIAIYLSVKHKTVKYIVSKDSVIAEYGGKSVKVPLNDIVTIMLLDNMSFKKILQYEVEDTGNVILMNHRRNDLVKLSLKNGTTLILSPLDPENFIESLEYAKSTM